MSGRDLLYKPPVPIPIGESEDAKQDGKNPGKKLGVTLPSRDLGGVGEVLKARAPQPMDPSKSDSKATPAYKAAYFNQDVSAVKQANLRARTAQALRGAEGASDLRKIVLPPAVGVENPEPAQIRAATDLMGLDGSFALDLQTLVNRQVAFARSPSVTVELLRTRMAMLEEMVRARVIALARMKHGRGKRRAVSTTVATAERARGNAIEQAEDVASEGTTLVQETHAQAEGMHRRLAKMLGIKR